MLQCPPLAHFPQNFLKETLHTILRHAKFKALWESRYFCKNTKMLCASNTMEHLAFTSRMSA